MPKVRHRRQPLYFAEAGEVFLKSKRRQSSRTQATIQVALKALQGALLVEGEAKTSGGSFDMKQLSDPCQTDNPNCTCYDHVTEELQHRLQYGKKAYRPLSIYKFMCRWRELVQLLVRKGKIPDFDVPSYAKKNVKGPEVTAFTNREIKKLLGSEDVSASVKLAFCLSIYCGFRQQEILHLKTKDLSWQGSGYTIKVYAKHCEGHTHCRRTRVPRTENRYGWWLTKTREDRSAVVPDVVEEFLRPVLRECERLGTEWLFYGWNPEWPVAVSTFNLRFAQALEAAGLMKPKNRRWGWHACRRTFITRMLQKGTTTAEVAQVAGCSISNIERYLQPDDDAQMRRARDLYD